MHSDTNPSALLLSSSSLTVQILTRYLQFGQSEGIGKLLAKGKWRLHELHPEKHRHRVVEQDQDGGSPGAQDHCDVIFGELKRHRTPVEPTASDKKEKGEKKGIEVRIKKQSITIKG